MINKLKEVPLTLSQYNIWLDQQLNIKSSLYNIGGQVHIKGNINCCIMNQSINMIIEYNDVLRASFHSDSNGEPFQVFRDYKSYSLDTIDFSNDEQPLEKAISFMEKDFGVTFNLEYSELFKFSLIKLSDDHCIFYCKFHHLIMDGWSVSLLVKQVREIYQSLASGSLYDNDKYSYLDYVYDDIDYIKSGRYLKSEGYWKNKFKIKPKSIFSSSVFSSPIKSIGDSKRRSISVKRADYNSLESIALKNKSTFFSVLLALLYTYLYKLTGFNEIVVGIPLLNRASKKFKRTLGLFAETSPLLVDFENIYSISDLIGKVSQSLGECYRHQRYPVTEIKKMANSTSMKRLFDVVFSYEKHTYDEKFNGFDTYGLSMHCNNQTNTLTIHVEECGEEEDVVIHFDYRCDCFKDFSIENFIEKFEVLYKSFIRNPEVSINQIEIISDDERNQLLNTFNNTKKNYSHCHSVISLFEGQVALVPNNTAVVYENEEISYRKLNELSNKVAHYLQDKYKIKANDIVGIQLDRSEKAIIVLLGILKAGAAYVPIDPTYPQSRIDYIIQDSNPIVVIDNYNVDTFLNNEYSICNPDIIIDENSLLYVIYTSGTTGLPKGTLITNSNYLNYLMWSKDYYFKDINKGHFPLFTSLSFDLTTTSIYLALCRGKSITVFNQHTNLTDILEEIFSGGVIDSVKLTPSHISLLLNMNISPENVDLAIVGGEELLNQHVEILHKINPNIRTVNEYGPTEATVGCIVKDITIEDKKILIGKPISNTYIYILDKNWALSPKGIEGEIYIGGKGLALGYLGKEDLTREKFIENPFNKREIIYRTGDLGRWLENGDIEYLGRIDDQVKIRGHRVELGEIENSMLNITGIQFVVADIRNSCNGDKFLSVYYISDNEFEIKELRKSLSKTLPDYMIPSYFIPVKSIPLTSNGKVDKSSLPDPIDNSISASVDYAPPRNKTETNLIEAWTSVINPKNKIGIDDNFFEIGGDSIKAIQIMSRLKQIGINGEVSNLFDNPTVREFSKTLNENIKVIDQTPISGEVILTPIQQWFFKEVDGPKNHYNQSVLLEIKKNIDKEFLSFIKASANELLNHHDGLRMKFSRKEGVVQENRPINFSSIDIEEYNLKSEVNPKEKMNEIGHKIQSSFNLESDILIKFAVFLLSDKSYLFIVAHHLIIDGVSWRILIKDLEVVLDQKTNGESIKLPLKTTSYKEWSDKIKVYANSRKLNSETFFWRNINNKINNFLSKKSNNNLKSLAKTYLDPKRTGFLLTKINNILSANINEVLITVLIKVIKSLGDSKGKVSVDLESHGRALISKDIDISRTIGWFTSIYPVVFDFDENLNIEEEIITVKEVLDEIPVNGIGYGILKYILNDNKLNKRPDVLFNYLGQFDNEFDGKYFKFCMDQVGENVSNDTTLNYILIINSLIIDNQLVISAESDVLNQTFLENILNQFSQELKSLIDYASNKESLLNDINAENKKVDSEKTRRIRI